ncbi:alpha-glucan family phosphorylase [Candidatus Woesearchaeota archaeon]|nr:alpha-glucan family phosphorylase [Candidatus Woesearchaeota archaeon]
MSADKIVVNVCSEIGLDEKSVMAGGLGELIGSEIKSAADLEKPMTGLTLAYNQEKDNVDLETKVTVPIEGRDVDVHGFIKEYTGNSGHKTHVLKAGTTAGCNPDYDQRICDVPYMEEKNDHKYWKICQSIVLGIGGVRMLHELNKKDSSRFPLPEVWHLNEWSGAFAALELMKIYGEKEAKEKTVFTIHTPVEAGQEKFDYGKVYAMLGDYLKGIDLRKLASYDRLNMTLLGVNRSRKVNGVSFIHSLVTKPMFPDCEYVRNGVHSYTWTCPEYQKLYDQHIPEWRQDPGALIKADIITKEDFLKAHYGAKKRLMDVVNDEAGEQKFYPEVLTIGFARRFAEYKRAYLLFSNIEELVRIVRRCMKYKRLQILYAGNPHPNDDIGRGIKDYIKKVGEERKDSINVWTLKNHNMETVKQLVAGCDIWLNTPRRPLESSQTSGPKAAHNGVPHFSIIDGWWYDVPIIGGERQGGWSIGPEPDLNNLWKGDNLEDAQSLLKALEFAVIPSYMYNDAFYLKGIGAIKNAAYYNSHRVVKDYYTKIY